MISTLGLMEVAVSTQEAKTRRDNHEFHAFGSRLALDQEALREWLRKISCLSINGDNGITVEYGGYWSFASLLQDWASHEAMNFSRSKRGSSGSVTTWVGVSLGCLDTERMGWDSPPPLEGSCCFFQASL